MIGYSPWGCFDKTNGVQVFIGMSQQRNGMHQ